MASSPLLEAISGLLTRDVLSRASALLGEPEPGISKALGAAAPALLAALLRKTDDPTSITQLRGLIDDPAADASHVLGDLGSVLTGGSSVGSRMLTWLFGDRTSGLASALASFAGVRPSTASSLLSLASPLVLSVLRDRSRAEGVGPQGLARWLGSQRSAIEGAVPAALASYLAEPARRAATPPMPEVRREGPRRGFNWLWPLVGLLLLGGLWVLLRSPGEPRVAERPQATAPAPVAAPPPAQVRARRVLPDGTALEVEVDRFESQLLAYLEDPNRPLDPADWFDFDRLLFETDAAVLKPESRAQLRDVAAILRAYPSVRVKIGGYTDNQGDPAYNLRLSQERAANVVRELTALGVDASRLEAEGYGEQHPVASNATEEGRARNRRIAVRVVQR